MTSKEILADLMAEDNFNSWMKLLKRDDVKNYILSLDTDQIFRGDMKFIRTCIRKKIKFEHINLMLSYTEDTRDAILEAFLRNYYDQDVELILKSGLGAYRVELLCQLVEYEKTKELIPILKRDFTIEQINQICLGVKESLDIKQIKLYAKPEIPAPSMKLIRILLQEKYPLNKIKLLGSGKLKYHTVSKLYTLVKKGISYDELKVLANPDCSIHAIDAMVDCLDKGMKLDDVRKIAHLEYYQIQAILHAYVLKYPAWFKEYCMDTRYSKEQFEQIWRAYTHGIEQSKIEIMANPEYSSEVMRMLTNCFKAHYTDEQINLLVSIAKDTDKFTEVVVAIFNGESEDRIKEIIDTVSKTAKSQLLDRLLA